MIKRYNMTPGNAIVIALTHHHHITNTSVKNHFVLLVHHRHHTPASLSNIVALAGEDADSKEPLRSYISH